MPEHEQKPSKGRRRQNIIIRGMASTLENAQFVKWVVIHADTEFGVLHHSTCCHRRTCMIAKMGLTLLPDPYGHQAEWRSLDDDRLKSGLDIIAKEEGVIVDKELIGRGVMTLESVGPGGQNDGGMLDLLYSHSVSEISREGIAAALLMFSERLQCGVGNFIVVFGVSLFDDLIKQLNIPGLEIQSPSATVGIASSMAYIEHLRDEYGDEIREELSRLDRLMKEREEQRE